MAEQKSFGEVLYGNLERFEQIMLVVLTLGVAATLWGYSEALTIVIISLGGLAGIFFLMGFRPPSVRPDTSNGKQGFTQLLLDTILPKVLWISCAVCTISILLYHLDNGNDGYKQGIFIHLSITAVSLIVIGGASVAGKNVRPLLPILFRAVPLAFVGYHFFQS
jgi:hypothetical protein